MTKWFIVIFIAALAAVMNAAVMDSRYGMLPLFYGVLAVNAFAIGLLLIWLASYFTKLKSRGFGVVGHSLVYLAAGIALIGVGHYGLAWHLCASPSSRLTALAFENNACGLLSWFSIGLGVFVLWPTARLLSDLRGRSRI